MTDYDILAEFTFSSRTFRKIFRERPENVLKILVRQINFFISGWAAYTKNINSSVQRIDLRAVGLYVRTLGFIFFRVGSPASY